MKGKTLNTSQKKTNKGFSILHQNIRSARNKINMIEALVAELNPDLLCLTELGLGKTEVEELRIPGYSLKANYCRSNMKQQNGHGGVGIYISNKINSIVEPLDVSSYCSDGLIEIAAVKIKFKSSSVLINCVYRPPTLIKEKIDTALELLTDCLHETYRNMDGLVIVGDTNICMLSNDYRYKKLMECAKIFNLRSVLNLPTRVTQSTSSSIDNILITASIPHTAKVHETAITDHHGVSLTIAIKKDHKPQLHRVVRSYDEENCFLYKERLKSQNWLDVYSKDDTNEAYEAFAGILQCLRDISFPLVKQKEKNSHKEKLDPTAIKLKQNIIALVELRNSGLLADDESKLRIKKAKEEYRDYLNQTKRNKIANKLQNSACLIKDAWKIVNQERKSKDNQKGVTSLVENDKKITEAKEIADMLNDFFIKEPSRLVVDNEKVILGGLPAVPSLGNPVNKGMFLFPVSEYEVLKIITSLKNKTSTGQDGTSNFLLKLVAEEIAKPLAHVINLSFQEACFPKALKISRVTPVFKKGSKENKENYRPISLVSSIGKVFEKAFYSRLSGFLAKHTVISVNQHGFQRGKSTIGAVLEATEKILEGMDQKRSVLGIFLDSSKAFDCVEHAVLLNVLSNYGIRGNANNWLRSYLQDREQYIEVECVIGNCWEHVKSENLKIERGVPQGSVLGPLLYLVYANPLLQNTLKTGVSRMMFADDTTSLIAASSLSDAEITANIEAGAIVQELANQSLVVNRKKTTFIWFGASLNSFEPKLFAGDEEIGRADETKFLGMTIDKNMTWDGHIEHLTDKLSAGLFVLRRISQIADEKTALMVYYALVHSHISYGIVLWASAGEGKREQILKLQKRAIRCITGIGRLESCRDHFRRLGILTVTSLFILEAATLVRDNLSSLETLGNSHSYNTRNREQFSTPAHRTKKYESSPLYQGRRVYSHLPEAIREASTRSIFRKRLKNHLIEKAYYSLYEMTGPCLPSLHIN